ncbi:hypothetical protein AUEXF2481DRAFT_5619 [Aureobasidium subglaciale EXF-2481]|uniref:Uncharacterized protein n=1 Tax=Aureobasidium subglaciale (strain EXF-2481) TaxID=1043005 RepID=A0A074Z778_AURSE|nr:uncharacterized protein AUEXF2481DRAFT_5619 [Aureobasidium subglaciale EXF-2481]KAI5212536.1 hypothetical protein E4T38_00470 [Aureobasidium subglaciale]KAI5231714.1 hypothetical protein E4T40_00434 [Aureobasidium subglaciale]KAI5234471.1 hypothetical protein E4T41_00469 [Aureobasidium subglaciale]KAI5267844.1 hypothetical protein E4T46_00469 [Aureobasidium subglaciale]KEQ94736.1 hypothetical protein AUEXF2481DRAFT_5619 [Aureobasidium subglaciale EXF-2481]
MASTKVKPGRPVYKADTSVKSPLIPELSKDQNEIVLGLLGSLLEPIGRHRAAHTPKSSGKKSKKRKRSSEKAIELNAASEPLEPVILNYLTVGLNSTSRQLELEAASSKSGISSAANEDTGASKQAFARHLAVIFLPKPPENLVYAHLPLLCYAPSVKYKEKSQQTRLVLLDSSCERTIAAAMGLTRAGVVGVFDDAPGSVSLLNYVRDNVVPVEVPWLEKALSGDWTGVTTECHVPGQA